MHSMMKLARNVMLRTKLLRAKVRKTRRVDVRLSFDGSFANEVSKNLLDGDLSLRRLNSGGRRG